MRQALEVTPKPQALLVEMGGGISLAGKSMPTTCDECVHVFWRKELKEKTGGADSPLSLSLRVHEE